MALEQISSIGPTSATALDGPGDEALARYLSLSPQERLDTAARGVEVVTSARLRGVEPGAVARVILSLLEDRAWGRDLTDGRSPRRTLVEQLLDLGYPWALSVHPGDLEWARQEQRAGTTRAGDVVRAGMLGFFVGMLLAQLAPLLPF